MIKRAVVLLFAAAAVAGLTRSASAQSTVGVRAGFDTEFSALVLGAETRFPINRIEDFPLTANPSFEYYLIDRYPNLAETMVEVNGNAYYEFELEDEEQLTPYAGAGLGLRYYGVEETALPDPPEEGLDLIVNVVGGAAYQIDQPFRPFGHLRLSLGGGTSTVALVAGLLFEL